MNYDFTPSFLDSFRIQLEGTTQLILFNPMQAIPMLVEDGFIDSSANPLMQLQNVCKAMTAKSLVALKGKGLELFHGNIHANDITFIPCGWFVMECNQGGTASYVQSQYALSPNAQGSSDTVQYLMNLHPGKVPSEQLAILLDTFAVHKNKQAKAG